MLFESLIDEIWQGFSRRQRGLAGRDYRYQKLPHQGKQERARRVRQIQRGILRPELRKEPRQ